MNKLEKVLVAKRYSYTKNQNNEITITNNGGVYLNGLTCFDAINLGNEKRKIKIISHKTKGLFVNLGCFFGNETEAINAIRLKYSNNSYY